MQKPLGKSKVLCHSREGNEAFDGRLLSMPPFRPNPKFLAKKAKQRRIARNHGSVTDKSQLREICKAAMQEKPVTVIPEDLTPAWMKKRWAS